jgi:Nucleoside transporter
LLTFVQVFIIIWGHKLSYVFRISGGFLVIAVLMIILPFVTNYLDPDQGFIACMVVLIVFGATGGFVQGSVFGLAGMLPGKFMGAVMFGNGISGIAINAMRAICLAIFPPIKGSSNSFYGALVYFILAAVLLIISSFAFVYFIKLPVVQYYVKKATHEKMNAFRRVSTARGLPHQQAASSNSLLEINKSGMTVESSVLASEEDHR